MSTDQYVKRAIVLVLGDIGHSPRMCYHASSLASHGVNVELIGYAGSKPHKKILENDLIKIVNLPTAPKWFNSVPRFLQLFLKLIFMFFTLFWTLLFKTSFQVSILMVQNPPGIPSMIVCYCVARLKRASFIVDWHNYSYTMLKQTLPKTSSQGQMAQIYNSIKEFLINLAYKLEGFSGKCADQDVCVSNAMRLDLKQRWNINAITLHDKPPEWNFVSISHKERHDLFKRLFKTDSFKNYKDTLGKLEGCPESTLFTYVDKESNFQLRDDRPLLLMSSTSWTEDEDFGILLDALKDYDKVAETRNSSTDKAILPNIFVIITGKGPERDFYLEIISQMQMRHVEIVTAWLEAEDYPRLLACADLGVSLHTSTSGLDLPMKIIDMFGCGLPVLAKQFSTIDEQISEGQNGRLFDTSTQLRQILVELAMGFPDNQFLNSLKHNVSVEHRSNWHQQWDAILWSIFDAILLIPEREYHRWQRFQITQEEEYSHKSPENKRRTKRMVLVNKTKAEENNYEDVSISDSHSNVSIDN